MATPSEEIEEIFSIKLTDTQFKVIQHLTSGVDVFLSLKTGGGKSLCYQAFPTFVKDARNPQPKVLIVSPLLSIMREQVSFLRQIGFTAGFVGESAVVDQEILDGKCQFVFVSPESALVSSKWRSYWKATSFALVVVDEAHTVVNWSESIAGEEPFRVWYGRVGELRSLIMKAPMLVLSATVNKSTRRKIKRKLAMVNCKDIIQSPDRENVKLFVLKVKTKKDDELFEWLLEELFEKEVNCTRFLIFCTTIDSCSNLFTMFKVHLPVDLHKHVQMYHSCTPLDVKEHIRVDMENGNGSIRVLLATSAAGMGVNYAGVNHVINYGPPHDMDTLVQEMGRAARDGSQGYQIIMFQGLQLSQLRLKGSKLKCQHKEMREYCLNDSICRRQLILNRYDAKKMVNVAHLCCDICARVCECGQADCADFGLPFLNQSPTIQPTSEPVVHDELSESDSDTSDEEDVHDES